MPSRRVREASPCPDNLFTWQSAPALLGGGGAWYLGPPCLGAKRRGRSLGVCGFSDARRRDRYSKLGVRGTCRTFRGLGLMSCFARPPRQHTGGFLRPAVGRPNVPSDTVVKLPGPASVDPAALGTLPPCRGRTHVLLTGCKYNSMRWITRLVRR